MPLLLYIYMDLICNVSQALQKIQHVKYFINEFTRILPVFCTFSISDGSIAASQYGDSHT